MLISKLATSQVAIRDLSNEFAFESSELADEIITHQQHAGVIAEESDAMVDGAITHGALSNTIGELSDYAEAGQLTEVTLESFRVRIDAILAAGGVSAGSHDFIPSFEAEDGEEPAKKAEGALARIWKWLKEAINRFVNMVKDFARRLNTSVPKMRALLTKARQNVESVRHLDVPQPEVTLKGNVANFLSGHGKTFKGGLTAVKTMDSQFESFLKIWREMFSHLDHLEDAIGNNGPEAGMRWTNAAQGLMRLKNIQTNDYEFAPGHIFRFVAGSDKTNHLRGAKLQHLSDRATEAVTVKGDTYVSLSSMLESMDGFYKRFEQFQTLVDATLGKLSKAKFLSGFVSAGAKRAGKASRAQAEHDPQARANAEIQEAASGISSAISIASKGYTIAMPLYLAYSKAIIDYSALCVSALKKSAKAAEAN